MTIANQAVTAQSLGFEKRIEGKSVTDPADQKIRIDRHRRDFDTSDVVVEGEVTDRIVAQRFKIAWSPCRCSWRSRESAGPHRRCRADGSCSSTSAWSPPGVVGVDQRKRLSCDVVLDGTV